MQIDAQRKQMIEEIVARSDFAKHPLDSVVGFVEGHG